MILLLALGFQAHAVDHTKALKKADKIGVQFVVPEGAAVAEPIESDEVTFYFNGSPPTRFTSKTAPTVQLSLPDGFRVRGWTKEKLKLAEKYQVIPNYPTAEAPHQVLVGMVAPERTEATLHGFRAIAAQHGANAIILDKTMKSALGVRLSEASPPPFPSADDAMAERIAGMDLTSRGYTLDGKAQTFDLASKVSWTFAADANSCYGLVLALDSDAILTDKAMKLISVKSKNSSRTYTKNSAGWTSKLYDRRSPSERTFFSTVSCTDKAANIEPSLGDAALGTGTVKIQMVKRASSASESRDALKDPKDDCWDCWFSNLAMCSADVKTYWDCPAVQSCIKEVGLKVDQCR